MKKKILVILLLAVNLYGCKKQNYMLNVIFDRVDGIDKGSEVLVNGIKAGYVDNTSLLKDKVLVKINISDKIKIPVNSKFIIQSGLLMNSGIYIESSGADSYLNEGDTVTGYFEQKRLLDNFISDSANIKKIEDGLKNVNDSLSMLIKRTKDSTAKIKDQ